MNKTAQTCSFRILKEQQQGCFYDAKDIFVRVEKGEMKLNILMRPISTHTHVKQYISANERNQKEKGSVVPTVLSKKNNEWMICELITLCVTAAAVQVK